MRKMIKLISMVCLVAMLIGMLPVLSVSAADTATLELETVFDSVKAGKEFTIDVNLANNPGIQASVFELNYDVNKFEYVGFEAGTLFGMTLVGVPTGTTNIVRFTLSSGGMNNVTDNGTIASVTFRAKEDVQVGDTYTFTTTNDPINTINGSNQYVALADASKTVTFVAANANLTTIDGAQVNLGTDISVTYKVTLDPDHAGAQMKFTTHGKEYYADPVATDEANVYEYTLINIAPQCMGDNIKAEVISGGATVRTKETYSILQNCQNLLDKSAAELKISDAKYAAMEDLIADLLVYGAAAQKYQNYKTNALVVDIPAELDAFDYESIKYTEGSSHDTAAFVSCNVKFDYTNSICYKFTAPDSITEANFKIVLDKLDPETFEPVADSLTYTLADFVLVDADTNTYALYVEMSVLDYDAYYSASLYVKGTRSWGDPKQFLDYNVNSYAARMQSSENVDMANLAKALYYYGQSAVDYQNAN